jgi:hypothetical protein
MSKNSATHCRHGHEWTPENTRIDRKGYRHCRACSYEKGLAYLAKRPKIQKAPRERRIPTGVVLVGTCSRGHPRTIQNTYFAPNGIRPCLDCRRAHDRSSRPVTAEKVRKVFELLHEGRPLCEAYGFRNNVYVGGKIVESSALIRFIRDNPRIGKRIRKLAKQNHYASMQAVADRKRLVVAPAILHNNGTSAYDAGLRATANLWEGERGDVMSLMFLAIAEGRLLPRDAERRMPEFLREHRRQFSKFGPLSLDAQIFGDGTVTLGDTVTTGLWQ